MKNDFKDIDSDDLDNALLLMQESFKIKFATEELQNIFTIDDLCGLIISKMETDSNSCTSQQAFYTIRQAVINVTGTPVKITPLTSLSQVIPKQLRRETIKNIEAHLGIQMHMLHSKIWIQNLLITFLFFSLFLLFVKLYYGIAAIIVFLVSCKIVSMSAKEFTCNNFSELIKSAITYNYVHFRKASDINKLEINNVVTTILKENTAIIIK